jgi:hypothetical protein
MTIDVGFHFIDKATYLDDPCDVPSLSASTAKTLVGSSPLHAHAFHPRLGGQRKGQTDAMETGSILDSLLCGGDTELVALPHVMPDAKGVMQPTNGEFRMKSAQLWKEEQKARGAIVMSAEDLDNYTTAAGILRQKLLDKGIDFRGKKQETMIWKEANGVLCRGRLDDKEEANGKIIISDLKVCENIRPDSLRNKIVAFGWDIQAAAYVRAVETLMNAHGRVFFRWIFAESEAPYDLMVKYPGGDLRTLGAWKWQTAVETWKRCLESDTWPGIGDINDEFISAPTWALKAMEEEIGESAT